MACDDAAEGLCPSARPLGRAIVFINGAETKAAQMFTLAHELVHLWLGQSALSDAQVSALPVQAVERWCNQVAADLLVPLDVFRGEYDRRADLPPEMGRLARRFKASTLVILRRMQDARVLTRAEYTAAYEEELARPQVGSPPQSQKPRRGDGSSLSFRESCRETR